MLVHPSDLESWRRWHETRHRIRNAARSMRQRFRPASPPGIEIFMPVDRADIVVAVDATHTSVDRAVIAPMGHLPSHRTAVIAPSGWNPPDGYSGHRRLALRLEELPHLLSPRAVLAAGHHGDIGGAAFRLADQKDRPFFVSQHGALTPFAPPLPPRAHLLSWSDGDSEFWISGRRDVTATTTGSQLLWVAGGGPSGAPLAPVPSWTGAPQEVLTYLGQGHAAEISRARLIHAALATCRKHHAVYRPHPSERDIASRTVLAAYARAGIPVDTAGVPLVDLEGPVIGVFSTGVLEAAARGRQVWVDFPRPPAWLGEFWERYGMHRLGQSPTPAPPLPAQEPARRVAQLVVEAAS